MTVKTCALPDYVSIVFEDTGVGIHEEEQPHIFEPFLSTKGSDIENMDGVNCYFGLNIFGGDSDSLLGRFTKNNEV